MSTKAAMVCSLAGSRAVSQTAGAECSLFPHLPGLPSRVENSSVPLGH